MTDLLYRSARELIAELAARRISARELLEAFASRNDALHTELNAVVDTDLERAGTEAARLDEARLRDAPLGVLAGLPMTVKDGFDVVGMPAVCGLPDMVGRAKDCTDADVVAAARGAGAVVWGKTNVPARLSDFQSYNAVYGTTNNPYDRGCTPGGSSGGSAAALAAGITPLEIGSDIAGSLRHPANFCGVYALKPTWSALSMHGQLSPVLGTYVERDLGVVGPMARTVGDLTLLWDLLRGGRPTTSAPAAGARVALWLDDLELLLADEVRQVIQDAADALRGQGVTVAVSAPPVPVGRLLDTYLALLMPIVMADAPDPVYQHLLAETERGGGADRYGFEAIARHATASYRAVWRAELARQELKNALADWFTTWDAILAPISPVPPFTHRQEGAIADRVLEVNGRTEPYLRMVDWIALATATHLPALAAPVGRTSSGLPVGAQLIGRWNAESQLFALAEALERAVGGFSPPTL
jgi:amidase